MERVERFELSSSVWKTEALPLDDTCFGAGERNRTPVLLFTRQVLGQRELHQQNLEPASPLKGRMGFHDTFLLIESSLSAAGKTELQGHRASPL